ncbi:MAG: molybdenum cofactor biosynthesis protein MoaE [Planctomycetaceae bacterium]|nr:molybdenum cofactor biosynthesis protein MoaE [Planctomycetaceae bacterium]
MVRLTREPIDYAALTERVRSSQAGAVVLFLGTVREMTAGRRTIALDYEAYPEMAIIKMQQLCDEASTRWPITAAAIEHRLGRLELGEISVALAVSSPHRADAFEAGRFLIDRLKEIVPVWKQENWDDGTTEWVHPDSTMTAKLAMQSPSHEEADGRSETN